LQPEEATMAIVRQLKRAITKLTALGEPATRTVEPPRVRRAPQAFRLREQGRTPNNPRLPLVIYRNAVRFGKGNDPAAVLEEVFARHGWHQAWRDGIYDFLHFHSAAHEVLGVARGRVTVRFGGGPQGPRLTLQPGDVAVLPAGTGHCRVRASRDLLVVGAYAEGGRYDEPRPDDLEPAEARKAIARVPRPQRDPVYGAAGPLASLWRSALSPRQRQRAGLRSERRRGADAAKANRA
jgi:uncharacterized protein YjlB